MIVFSVGGEGRGIIDRRRMGSVDDESLNYKGSERHLMLAHRCGVRARVRVSASVRAKARLVVCLIR